MTDALYVRCKKCFDAGAVNVLAVKFDGDWVEVWCQNHTPQLSVFRREVLLSEAPPDVGPAVAV